MDVFKVIYSPAALDDLKSIYRYIAVDLQEEVTAENQINRIRKTIRDLDTFPAKYKTVEWEPWSDLQMRQMSVDNYLVYYLVDKEKLQVTIVRIFYGGRDIKHII